MTSTDLPKTSAADAAHRSRSPNRRVAVAGLIARFGVLMQACATSCSELGPASVFANIRHPQERASPHAQVTGEAERALESLLLGAQHREDRALRVARTPHARSLWACGPRHCTLTALWPSGPFRSISTTHATPCKPNRASSPRPCSAGKRGPIALSRQNPSSRRGVLRESLRVSGDVTERTSDVAAMPSIVMAACGRRPSPPS